ncbi:MAG: hypothetical protein K2O81_03660, partial [Clostridia bacterium]|nr:hypothetical protein [Clostridia bacterium]
MLKIPTGGGSHLLSINKQGVKRVLLYILMLLFCALLCIGAVFSFSKSVSVQAYNSTGSDSVLPSEDNKVIGQIYKNGVFVENNLNTLAKAVNYAGIKKLAEDAVKDGFEPLTSEDFGDIVVKFGEYEFQGNKYELTWIPVYVSNSEDEQGNKSAILTLWLATVGTNEVESYQEATTWSSGRYSSRTGQEYNGNTVYCNTYDGSYIRHYILNGST